MQFSQGQSLNSRIAAFEIFQLRQVELNSVNVTPSIGGIFSRRRTSLRDIHPF